MNLIEFKQLKIGEEVLVYDNHFVKKGEIVGFMDGYNAAYVDTREILAGKRAYGWYRIFTSDKKGLRMLYDEIDNDIDILKDRLKEVHEMLESDIL